MTYTTQINIIIAMNTVINRHYFKYVLNRTGKIQFKDQIIFNSP